MIQFLSYSIRSLWARYQLHKELNRRFPTCSFADNIYVNGSLDNLELGERVVIQSNTYLHLGGFDWCNHTGKLVIGSDSCISPNCVIYAAGSGGVHIGSGFDCGPGVGIFASRSDEQNKGQHIFKPVQIGNNVIVYANAVISPGVSIGNKSVIMAGAVVTSNVGDGIRVGGIPARSQNND